MCNVYEIINIIILILMKSNVIMKINDNRK